jgi:uncharacterized protein
MEQFSIAEHKMFHVDGHDFIFLTKENAIFEVEHHLRRILDWCSPNQVLTRQEFLSHVGGSPEEKRELLTGLVKSQVLVPLTPGACAGREASTTRRSCPIPLQTLILQVTDACNLACSYCYYAGGNAAAKHKQRQWMAPAIAERGIDFLLEHSTGLKKLVVVFFGGEPLLNYKLITSSVAYARSRAAAAEKHVDFALTTNGTLLEDDVVRYLLAQEIGVTVSVDGFEEVHDKHRRFSNGDPSYRVILPGLKRLLDGASRRPAVARVTLAGDPRHVPKILDHLLGLGFVEVGFSPVTSNDSAHQMDVEQMDHLLAQFERLSARFVEAARNEEFLGFSNLIDLLVVLHQSEVKNYPCGAGLGLFSMDTAGRLYVCQRFTGEELFCMGDVFEGFDYGRLEGFRREAEIGQKPACRNCWARATCAGGCYYEGWIREGSPFTANFHSCEWIKRWVELGLRVYGQIYLANPAYLDKLAMLRGHASIFNQLYLNDRRLA